MLLSYSLLQSLALMKKDNNEEQSLCLVIPVYNEEEAIANVLVEWCDTLSSLAIDFKILCYNDGSKDNSADVLNKIAAERPNQIIATNKPNEGHGPTILRGYREGAKMADWIFQIDSDNEMGSASFKSMWEQREGYDFLLGRRDGRAQPLPRKLISMVSRMVVRVFYGKSVWDVNAPYRLMRSAAFDELFQKIPHDTFAPNVIVSGYVGKKHLKFKEIDVSHQDRQTGEVSIKKWKLLKAAARSFYQTISFSFKQL